jgi:hypothetical protein
VAAVDTKESLAPKKTRKRKKTKNKLAHEVVRSNTESLTKLSDLGNKWALHKIVCKAKRI